jgi:hypothetical protein
MAKQAKRAEPAKKLPYPEDVDRKLASLHGVRRSDLTPDDRRGAGSPLGHGEIAERRKRR